ncbi:hypothetical protein DFH09DRAFT_1426606 [Mycena vulgaris]|nr:hypothetical protein DFH09DRAFT_1426606 [Mycena vulgaris]
MSTYKSFAVVGAGKIGMPVLNALAAKNVSVVLLSRPEGEAKPVPAGVQVFKVDHSDATAVAAVFKAHEVEVVVSTITSMAVAAQKSLVEAAKLATVKLFTPSEFGMPPDGHAEGPFAAKGHVAEQLKAAGIPSIRFYTGMFIEFIPWLIGYPEDGKIGIVGKGEVPVSFTSIQDIAGERRSLNELGPLFKTTVEHVQYITGELGGLRTGLLGIIDSGESSTGWDATAKAEGSGSNAAGSANALWPGHQWKTIKDVHNL